MKEITERTLKVENVSLGYGETTIVKDLSLEFPKGKITAIIGPNGCGKSTLLRGVSRLLKPLNGDFTLDQCFRVEDIQAFLREYVALPTEETEPSNP